MQGNAIAKKYVSALCRKRHCNAIVSAGNAIANKYVSALLQENAMETSCKIYSCFGSCVEFVANERKHPCNSSENATCIETFCKVFPTDFCEEQICSLVSGVRAWRGNTIAILQKMLATHLARCFQRIFPEGRDMFVSEWNWSGEEKYCSEEETPRRYVSSYPTSTAVKRKDRKHTVVATVYFLIPYISTRKV